MPLATATQEVMPPKTLTNTLLTCGSPRMTSSPAAMTSADAPPPMSRKLAGFTPPWLLAGVGDDVEGRHDEPGAVADDADLAVELDVVEVVFLGLRLERVRLGLVFERLVLRMTEVGVRVEGHLAVEGEDLAGAGQHERVDLDERRVLAGVDLVELHENRGDLVDELGRELRGDRDLLRLLEVDAGRPGRPRCGRAPRDAPQRAARCPCRPRSCRARGTSGSRGRAARRSSTPP